jgi:PAS domain S-box-containing protein
MPNILSIGVRTRQPRNMATKSDPPPSHDTERVAYFVMDGDGNIVEWDDDSEAIFGWTRAEALGARLSELIIPEHQRAMHEYGLMRYKATGQGKFIGKPIQIVTLNRSGGEVPIAITISMEREGEGYRFPTVARVMEKDPTA